MSNAEGKNLIPGTPGVSSYDTFLDYRAVLICAIAEAWRDESYRDLLERDPERALLEKYKYKLPYDLKLTCDANSAEYRPDLVTDWVAKIFCTINLQLPPKPEREEDIATALANYNLGHLTFLRPRKAPSVQDLLKLLEHPEYMNKLLDHPAFAEKVRSIVGQLK